MQRPIVLKLKGKVLCQRLESIKMRYNHYLIWRGDVPVKKTLVLFGSMCSSTHFDHVLITLSYASGLGTSSYSVAPSSNDPRLLHTNPYKFHQLVSNIKWSKKKKEYRIWLVCLQYFHIESVHPPYVGIKDKIICILPIQPMLFNWFRHYYSVQYAMHIWIIWIWFYKKWGPVEFHRSNYILWLLHKQQRVHPKQHWIKQILVIADTTCSFWTTKILSQSSKARSCYH